MNKYKTIKVFSGFNREPVLTIKNAMSISFQPYYINRHNEVIYDGRYHNLIVSTVYTDCSFKMPVEKIIIEGDKDE